MRDFPHSLPHHETPCSRRDFLTRAGGGLGMLALLSLLEREAKAADNPLAARTPHSRPTAKSVIWLFLDGGPSHVDLFDPKPALTKLAGKPLPPTFRRPVTPMGVTAHSPLLASKRKFARHGQAGTWVSDWLPEVAKGADDIAVLR